MTNDVLSEKTGESCFFCGSRRVHKTLKRRSVNFFCLRHFYQCEECKGFSLWPKLEDREVQSLYSTNYIKNVNPESSANHDSNLKRFENLFQILSNAENCKDKKFLDYGCGASAETVLFAKNLGYHSFGVEVESKTRNQAHQASGCEIYSPEELRSSHQEFEIVFLGDVLEHVCNPIAILSDVFDLLSPEGMLVIQGPIEGAPTFANFLIAIKSKYLTKSPTTFPPYHVSLATQSSIIKMLKSQKFNVLEIEISEPLWPATKLGTKASLESFQKFLISLTKFVDMTFHKFKKSYGTRFFLVATKLPAKSFGVE